MNVASVFALLTGRYMVGALSFSPTLKIGPIPTPGTPGFIWPVLDASRLSQRTSASCTARCRNASVVERVGNGPILPAVAAAIYGASALLSRPPDQQPAREQLYSHYAIDSRDGKLVIPSQVALTPI
jgi:hypothetical protein